MLWLDNVLAVPSIAIHLKKNLPRSLDFQKTMLSFIDNVCKNTIVRITSIEIWGYEIIADDFTYVLKPDQIFVKFRYPIKEQLNPGGFTSLIIPNILSFTELFDKSFSRVQDILKLLDTLRGFEYELIGLVVDVDLDKGSIPPGIDQYLKHLGKPWNKAPMRADSKISIVLKEGETFSERCHHGVILNQESENNVGCKVHLDWQRLFNNPQPLSYKKICRDLESCKEDAFQYFNVFGSGGDLDYESIDNELIPIV